MNDHNECPTCTQDWVANTDYECGCCGRPASEHIRVTSLCRILRETQQREHTLERERNKHHEDADAFLDKWSKAQERAIDAERELDELKMQLKQTREQHRLSSVCRELKAENEKLKALLEEKETYIQRVITWPHDADPFTSPDHDHDQNIYQ